MPEVAPRRPGGGVRIRTPRTTILSALALVALADVDRNGQAQVAPPAVEVSAAVPTDLEEIEEIIVRGRSFGELRFEIRRAEEAVWARFNELNSTDDFDIHCRFEKVGYMRSRHCESNISRSLAAKIAVALVRRNPSLAQFYAMEARGKQQLLSEEMQQLATEDEEFQDAIAELSQTQFALTLARGNTTLFRQVTAASGTLPYDAELMFEIIMGNHPFRHRLTQQTFTIADVLGEIRKLQLQCAEGSQRIEYESGVDWTVPSGWSACTLQVNAKQETTFRLYEF